jgi:hypothetical protein
MMLDRDRAQSVEAVRLDPEVGIREATAQLGCVDEQLEGARDLAARGGNEPEAAQRNALPVRCQKSVRASDLRRSAEDARSGMISARVVASALSKLSAVRRAIS